MENKEKREYIILAYEPKTFEYLKECGYNLSPNYFMRIKENSKIGRLIKNKVLKSLEKRKGDRK